MAFPKILLTTVYLAPLLLLLLGSLHSDEGAAWTLGNYPDVFRRVPFPRYFFNSVWIAAWTVGLGLVVNSLAGYALARLRFRGRALLFAAVVLSALLPFEAVAVPLFYACSRLGFRDTYVVQILPFVANSFSLMLFYTFFLDFPKELEEAARVDGATAWTVYLQVVLPNSGPVVATAAILTFLASWNNYLWPLLVTGGEKVRPLPLAIAEFHTLPPLHWGDIYAFGVMMVMPTVCVFLLFQRAFVQSFARSGIK